MTRAEEKALTRLATVAFVAEKLATEFLPKVMSSPVAMRELEMIGEHFQRLLEAVRLEADNDDEAMGKPSQ